MSGLGKTIGKALGIGGRIPPQAIDMEQAVIGAVLVETHAFHSVSEILRSEMFYSPKNKVIFWAAEELHKAHEPIDLLTVKNHLSKNEKLEEAGGIFYLTELTSKMAGAAHLGYHSAVVAQKFMMRKLIDIGQTLATDGYDDTQDPFAMIDDLKAKIDGLNLPSEQFVSFADAINTAEEEIEKIDKGELLLLPGLPFLPNMSFMPGELVLIAADSGTGKTTVALQWQQSMCNTGFDGIFDSLEMNPKSIAMKEMAHKAGVSGMRLRQGGLTQDQWESWQILKSIKNLHIVNCFTVDELKRKVKSFKRRNKSKKTMHVAIDYFQLMKGEGQGENKYAEIGHELKQFALEEEIVLIVLSQINREWIKNKPCKPGIHNIRNSDAIRHDSDFVFILFRPEQVDVDTFDDGRSTRGMGVCIVGKLRSGWDGKNEWICHIVNGQWYSEAQYNALARPVHVDVFNSLPSFKNKSDFDADELEKFGRDLV